MFAEGTAQRRSGVLKNQVHGMSGKGRIIQLYEERGAKLDKIVSRNAPTICSTFPVDKSKPYGNIAILGSMKALV